MGYDPNKRPINRSRIKKMEMDDEWIIGLLDKIKVGHISTLNGEQPFINPTSFFYNKEKHEIYFHSNAYGRMRFNAEGALKHVLNVLGLVVYYHQILHWK